MFTKKYLAIAFASLLVLASLVWAATPTEMRYGIRFKTEPIARITPPSGAVGMYASSSDRVVLISDSGTRTPIVVESLAGVASITTLTTTTLTATALTTDSITGDGTGAAIGLLASTEDVTGANTIAIAECGKTLTNTGASGTIIQTLPEASTAIGCELCFATIAAQLFNINPADGTDQILGLTNAAGDSIQSAGAGDYVCLMAVGASAWVVTASNNTIGNADAWADAN